MPDARLRPQRNLAIPRPGDRCHFCNRVRADVEERTKLVLLFGKWQCQDRVDCYQVWRPL